MIAGGKLAAGLAVTLLTWASLASGTLRGQNTPTGGTVAAAGDYLALQRRYVEMFQQISPAVVKINALRKEKPDDPVFTVYTGTGFFISRDGMIMTTNAHLLAGAERVVIEQGGVPYAAEVVGVDLVSNVALVRALKLPKDFVILPLNGDPGLPPIASLLFAVTCKMGEGPGPATGMLQGFNTNFGDQRLPTLHLRTSIPHDGGEGGSPVFDISGRLVGVMVAALPDTRSSLVLPTAAAQRVRDDLLSLGHVSYGRFGFTIQQIVGADAGPQVLITSVEYGGPAAVAELHTGDQLLAVGDRAIVKDEDLRQASFFSHPGQIVTVHVRRDGKEVELPLKVGEMTIETAATSAPKPVAPATSAAGNTTTTPNADAAATPPPFTNVPVAIGPRP